MDKMGYLLPIIIAFFTLFAIGLGLLDRGLQPKTDYEKWLTEELRVNPGYIDWLKVANNGKDYKMGLRIVRKLRRKERLDDK